jgi:streptogramin lyase
MGLVKPFVGNTACILIALIASANLSQMAVGSTDYTVHPGRSSWPYAMVVGPDKNLWFVELGGRKVGRITITGVITEFPIPNAQALLGIASGPDGNLWFADTMAGRIGHISTSGTDVVQYFLAAGSFPQGIIAGADGNLWFVEQKQSGDFEIGKITTAGKITSYSTKEKGGTFQVYGVDSPSSYGVITAGPDGNLWFVNPMNALYSQVGKITPAGAVIFYTTKDLPLAITSGPDGNLWVTESSHVAKVTTAGVETECAITNGGGTGITRGSDGNIWFSEANYGIGKVVPATCAVTEYGSLSPTLSNLASMTSGPDGNLWVTGEYSSNIGKINTSGTLIRTFALNVGATIFGDTAGPDGNLWFTAGGSNRIGKMTPDGVVTTYPLLSANADPTGITSGPDGNLWLLESDAENIAKVTPSGAITEYPIDGVSFFGIVTGPDGNLWFPYIYNNGCACSAIGRMTTSGAINVFPTTTASSSPVDVAVGSDGNIWFTENAANQIGKMSTEGVMLAEYPVKTKGANISAITSGPDGNLWFLENTSFGAAAKITTSGVVTEYKAQMQSFQNGIISGPDGAIWFAQAYPNAVARVTTKDVVSTVPLTALNALGGSLTVGPDHKIWVTEGLAGALGRLSAIGGTGQVFTATHGVEITKTVAVFVDGTPTATAPNFKATVYWGDGATSSSTISGKAGGPFDIRGRHTYSSAGTYYPYVTLQDTVDKSTYTSTKGKATVH